MTWISVDNPPDNQDNVLIIWEYMYAMWWYQPSNKTWYRMSCSEYEETYSVTHWRKLPKLPKWK